MQTGLYFNPINSNAQSVSATSDNLNIFAAEAEALGYDCFFLAEPSVVDNERLPNSFARIQNIANVTTSIKLGIADSVIAVEEPLAVGQHILKLEELLKKRHIAGVAVGEDEELFFHHCVPFEQCRDRFEEILNVLPKIWSGESFEHHGRYFQLDCDTAERAIKIDPKVWVTVRDMPTLSSAAKRGYSILPYILSEHRVVLEQYEAFDELLEPSDHNREIFDRPLVRDIFVANSNVEAEVRALDPFVKLYQRHAENCELLDQKNQPKFPESCSVNNILKHHLIIGDALSVAEQLSELTNATNCTHIIARMVAPGVEEPHALESMSLMQNAVLPSLIDHNAS